MKGGSVRGNPRNPFSSALSRTNSSSGFGKTQSKFKSNETKAEEPILQKNENTASSKTVVFQRNSVTSTCGILPNPKSIDQQILDRDHQKCVERQNLLIEKFRTENEEQESKVAQIQREKEDQVLLCKAIQEDLSKFKLRNKQLQDRQSEKLETIAALKREVNTLQKKHAVSQENTQDTLFNFNKLKSEYMTIKESNSEMRKSILQEKSEKERIWLEIREQSDKYQEMLISGSKHREKNADLINKIQNLQNEMKELKNKNSETLNFIQNK